MKMPRVRLFHWKPEEAAPVIDALRQAGCEVDFAAPPAYPAFRAVRQSPPDAVVIDLSRLPSHGREVATALRSGKTTRLVPILFLDGESDKVEKIRRLLPDAAYCTRARLAGTLKKCLKQKVENPVVPAQMMDRYAGRTTAQKLGIVAGARVAVVDAPRDYARAIGALPDGVEFEEGSWTGCAVTVWFCEEPDTLLASMPRMRRAAAASKLWVAWPKKAARKDSLLSETLIREVAIEHGMVDYKVCSVNETWSGLCLALKKS